MGIEKQQFNVSAEDLQRAMNATPEQIQKAIAESDIESGLAGTLPADLRRSLLKPEPVIEPALAMSLLMKHGKEAETIVLASKTLLSHLQSLETREAALNLLVQADKNLAELLLATQMRAVDFLDSEWTLNCIAANGMDRLILQENKLSEKGALILYDDSLNASMKRMALIDMAMKDENYASALFAALTEHMDAGIRHMALDGLSGLSLSSALMIAEGMNHHQDKSGALARSLLQNLA